MVEFIEAIRKLREEIEEQEREKMNFLEKIEAQMVKGEEEVNKLQNEIDTLQKEAATVETPVAPKTTDFILRVNIIEKTQV